MFAPFQMNITFGWRQTHLEGVGGGRKRTNPACFNHVELRLNLAQSCQGPQADTCGNVLLYPS